MSKLKIKTGNKNPNFTIILPGTCQAKCDFCFWKEDKNTKNFIKSLKKSLKKLPDIFYQISISGGEPTLSPVFDEAMKVINKFKKKGKIRKVVLTTNGINLIKKDLTGIDHVNISRHHYDEDMNISIFKTEHIPETKDLQKINTYVNKYGIDVNYNFVIVPGVNDDILLGEFIFWAKATGATSVTFRNQYEEYGISNIEKYIIEEGYKPTIVSTCPVCRTSTFYFKGMKLNFHSSDYEPTESKQFDENEVYELILQQNGDLTRDWEAKKIIMKG